MAANPYLYLPLADITAKLAQYNAAETAILTGAASYSMNGVSVTRAQLGNVQQAIQWLSAAQRRATGQRVTSARAITVRGGRVCP